MKPTRPEHVAHCRTHKTQGMTLLLAQGKVERPDSLDGECGTPRAHGRGFDTDDWQATGVTQQQRNARLRLAELMDLPMNFVNRSFRCAPIPLEQMSPRMRSMTEASLNARARLLGTPERPGPMRYVLDDTIELESSDDEGDAAPVGSTGQGDLAPRSKKV